MKDNRRYIIYGAGAVGGVVGGHLTVAGKDVVLIGRAGHINAINEHGLKFVTPAQTYTLHPAAVTSPDQIDFRPYDVVFLSVKSQDSDVALRVLKKTVDDVPIFCFQNGVRNEEMASVYFKQVYGVVVRVSSFFVTNGEVVARRDPAGYFIMGRYPAGTDALVESVAEDLRQAPFHVRVTPDVMPYKWGKLMANLRNAVRAITDKGDENKKLEQAMRVEAEGILARAGIRWEPPEISEPVTQSRSLPGPMYRSSTWQSLARQQGSVETDFFNGEIVRVAQRIGQRAPINETLLRIAQEMAAKRELPGKYTPDELARLCGVG